MAIDPMKQYLATKQYQAKWQALQNALNAEQQAESAFQALSGVQNEGQIDIELNQLRAGAFDALRPKIDEMVKASGIHDGFNDEVINNYGVESAAAKFRGSQQGGFKYQVAEQQVNTQIEGALLQRHAAMDVKHQLMEKRHNDLLKDPYALSAAQAFDIDREVQQIGSQRSQNVLEKELIAFKNQDRATDLAAQAIADANGKTHSVTSTAIASPELMDKLLDKPVSEGLQKLGRDRFGAKLGRDASSPAEPESDHGFFNFADEKEQKIFSEKVLPYARAVGQKREIVEARQARDVARQNVTVAQRDLVELMKLGGQEHMASIPPQDREQVLKFASLNPAKADDRAQLAATAKAQSIGDPSLLDSALRHIDPPGEEVNTTQQASSSTQTVAAQTAHAASLATAQNAAAQQQDLAVGLDAGLTTNGSRSSKSTVARQAQTQERLKFFEHSGLGVDSSAAALNDGKARFDAHWLANGQELTKQLEAKQAAAAAAKLAAQSQAQTNGLGAGPNKPRGRGM